MAKLKTTAFLTAITRDGRAFLKCFCVPGTRVFFHICQRITQFCLRVPHFSNLPSYCAFINVAFAFCISQFAFLFRIPALLYYNFFGFQGLRSHAHVFQILLRAPVLRSSTEKRFALLKLKRGIQRIKDYMSLCCCYSPTTPPPPY